LDAVGTEFLLRRVFRAVLVLVEELVAVAPDEAERSTSVMVEDAERIMVILDVRFVCVLGLVVLLLGLLVVLVEDVLPQRFLVGVAKPTTESRV
jgi:hypothetical protein